MMMAEAIAMSASKRTLCLRRSILRMRFIAAACQSGSVASAALAGTSMLITAFPRADPIFDSIMGLDPLDYSVAVKLNAAPQNSWRWEINCAGRSSPVHKSSVHFSTMGAASRAGKAALKQFLDRSIDTWPGAHVP